MKQVYFRQTLPTAVVGLITVWGLLLVMATALPAHAQDPVPAQTPATQDPAPQDPEKEPGLLEIARKDSRLSIFVRAVEAAGLTETLSGKGPFTVFAPTNAAFNALPEGTLNDLMKPENKQKLADILKYHVLSSKTMAMDLSKMENNSTIKTVQGGVIQLVFPADNTGVLLNNLARVVKADVSASNGVVHIIDKVLTLEPPTQPAPVNP
jgi:uncharacterized surface protein with fasciclin (FAS1) repeats